MNSKLSKIFKEMSQVEPKKGLEGSILQKIDFERGRQIKKKLVFSYFGFTFSFSAGICALAYFGSSFLKSEFWSILSLAFSDFMIVAGSWREYLYSLGETFPIMSVVAILVPIFGFLLSANLYFSLKRNKIIHMHNNLKFAA